MKNIVKSVIILFCICLSDVYANNFVKGVVATYENDSVYRTDKYYSNGVQAVVFSNDFENERFFSNIFNFQNIESYNYTFGLGQKIYTPKSTKRKDFLKDDRPYAGYLYIFANKNIWHDDIIDSFGLTFGTTGPNSFSEQSQKEIHRLIGSPIPQGWDNQLKNELLIMLSWSRAGVMYKTQYTNGLESMFIPRITVDLGTPFTDIKPSFEFRFGKNLNLDFISNKIENVAMGYKKQYDKSIYGFVGASANAILYNTFLDGNISGGVKTNIDKKLFTYEVIAGVAGIWNNYYIKQSSTFLSKEFKQQDNCQVLFMITFGYLL